MDEPLLKAGELAPDFSLVSDEGAPVRLSAFRGRKVLLYFYPKAGTPGCTQQACALRDLHPDVTENGVTIIGISPDSPDALRRFRTKYNLPFILLSDPDRKVARQYGAWGERSLYGRLVAGILRSHVALDPEGRVIEYDLRVKPLDTADAARRLARRQP